MTPKIINNIAALRQFINTEKNQGKKIGLVPTMGALHDGHLSLIAKAKQLSDTVLASIFVNPKQFSAKEDIERYPQPLQQDIAKLTSMGVAVIYTPSPSEMYPPGFLTNITMENLSTILCGASRPQHFDGVMVIVSKLFLQTMPDVAVFGEKDYQQLTIIRKMVKDLDFPITIVGAETVREASGLAMSSRNQYLTAGEREIAPVLFQTLSRVAQQIKNGDDQRDIFPLAISHLLSKGFQKVDYLEWRASHDLSPMQHTDKPSRLLVAAHLGRARLIDNIAID